MAGKKKHYLGIDIGSTTLKAVVMDASGKIRHQTYQRTRPVESGRLSCSGRCISCGNCNLGAIRKTVEAFLAEIGLTLKEMTATVVTGSQIVEGFRRFIPYDAQVSEVTAHAVGARFFYPECKAIIDVGGQDSKCMLYDENTGMWSSRMSGICAAGTGAFLDSVALKLGIPIEEMADKVDYGSQAEFSSVCAVLSATSINKFKNRMPIGAILAGACRAQARTIISGVGQLLYQYKGDILFQGGVAYNRAVAHFLEEITGCRIIVPPHHSVMGAIGAAWIAREYAAGAQVVAQKTLPFSANPLKATAMRATSTGHEFLGHADGQPAVWRNLFFPAELLNALGVRILTLETYAALFARNVRRTKKALDVAACKGFTGETCSFLRVLEGVRLPKSVFGVSTTQPCQQGERIFQDLARHNGGPGQFYSLHTPTDPGHEYAVEQIAEGLMEAQERLEAATGLKMEPGKLAEACELSNQAAEYSKRSNELRFNSPPLIRGLEGVYTAVLFSQLWGKKELVEIQKAYYEELAERAEAWKGKMDREETHRLLWLHLPPFYDTKLLDLIEVENRAPIVFEEVNFVNWEPLDPSEPYRSLARKLLQTGFLDPKLRIRYIRETALKAHFSGCILYNHGFGRCSLSDSSFVRYLREELNALKLPLLTLDGDCMDPSIDPCSTTTKVSAFVEALNLKKYGNIFGPAGKQW